MFVLDLKVYSIQVISICLRGSCHDISFYVETTSTQFNNPIPDMSFIIFKGVNVKSICCLLFYCIKEDM